MKTSTHRIPIHAIPYVTKVIASLNKKAAKLGCPLLTLDVHQGIHRSTKTTAVREVGSSELNVTGQTIVETVDITVHFETLVLNGWTPVCRIEHCRPSTFDPTAKLENVVYPSPCHLDPREIKERAKDKAPDCDHCKVHRHRNETFIVYNQETKVSMQVGSTCLADFIGGTEATQAVSAFNFISTLITVIGDECEGWDGEKGSPYHRTAYDTDLVLQVVAHTISKYGYLSKKDCTERHQTPTSQYVRQDIAEHIRGVRNWDYVVKALAQEYRYTITLSEARALGEQLKANPDAKPEILTRTDEEEAVLMGKVTSHALKDLLDKQGRGVKSVELRDPQFVGCNQTFAIPLLLTDEMRFKASCCRAWVLAQTDPAGYMHDLREVLANDLMSEAKIGLVTSALPAWERAVAREERKTMFAKSTYQGKLKERLVLQLRPVIVKQFAAKPQEGRSAVTLIEFTDATGLNCYAWWSNPESAAKFTGMKELTWVKATVKIHKEQDGVMITSLSRVAVAPAPKPAKASKVKKGELVA